jgi:hypothetical protein
MTQEMNCTHNVLLISPSTPATDGPVRWLQ